MAPGSTCIPVASSVSVAAGIASGAPIAWIFPSLTAMLARTFASGETRMPPWMTRSTLSCVVMVPLSSQHRPAAIDRQVDASDLARYVACEKQAGVGDVLVNRDALQRIIRGVTLRGLFFGYAELLRHVAADLFAEARAIDH